MKFEGKLTVAEIEQRTGIGYTTFIRLKQLGVVPYPEIKGLGKNQGIVGLYPPEVESIVRWAMQERKHGLSLVQIAEKWRQRKVEEGELVGQPPNPSVPNWAAKHFIELYARYPGDDFASAEIDDEPIVQNPDGTIVVKFKLIRVPRK